ncbi:hypothetical protein Ahy_A02g007109 isoform C [Arachis hypogaea]|uniref:Uncharacterized protein n=1 Tax=Arachis hypogaea TaxID=3818 RepID=A0A445EBV6_ARAHY|nr:hypothetical protein Ahy_A02g007109 isoform C [Arachis hypogaea]
MENADVERRVMMCSGGIHQKIKGQIRPRCQIPGQKRAAELMQKLERKSIKFNLLTDYAKRIL